MGDLACTLQNHLNPALFYEGRDVNGKLIAFFCTSEFLFWTRQLLTGCCFLSLKSIAFDFCEFWPHMDRHVHVLNINDVSYSPMITDKDPIPKVGH